MEHHAIWKDEYALGIKEIDAQHRFFIGLLDQAYTAHYNKDTMENIAVLLEKIKDYIILHFETEEKYFDLFNYEFKDEHREAHNDLKRRFGVLVKRFNDEGEGTTVDLIDFLENWLLIHLSTVDKKYVACFKEHGL